MRVLQFSGMLAAEEQKVCFPINVTEPDHERVDLAVPKITTLALVEIGGGVLHKLSDPQTYTMERQSKGRGKSIRFVLDRPKFLG
jgi:hypothetical protein